MTTIRTIVAIILAQVCFGVSVGEAQSAARDSSGIRIRDVSFAKPLAKLSLSATPLLDLGGDDQGTNYEFHRIASIVRTRTGEIVVANAGTLQLRYFDAKGQFVRAVGRKGGGPGEFGSITKLFLTAGDSVLASDDFEKRFVLFAPNGQHVRTVAMIAPQGRRIPNVLGVLADGTLITGSSDITTMAPRPEAYYFGQHLLVYSAEGKFVRDIGSFKASEHFVQRAPPEMGGTAYWDLAFGRTTTVAVLPDRVLVGDGTSFEVQYFASNGKVQEILRSKEAVRPLTPAIIQDYRERVLAGVKPEQKRVTDLRLDEMPYPTSIPAFRKFFVAQDRRIWVQRYPLQTDLSEKWVVLQPDGVLVDEIAMPRRFRLMGAGRDNVFGVWRDSDDVEHVQIFSLSPAGVSR